MDMKKRRDLTAHEKACAARLKAIWTQKRRELGLTQEDAAHILGFKTQGMVSHYLNGYIALNTDALLGFSDLLDIQPQDIDPLFSWVLVRPNASARLLLDTQSIADPRVRSAAESLVHALSSGSIDSEKFLAALKLLDLPNT
jgi:transcriptional regulator with XRE-family HTH domain